MSDDPETTLSESAAARIHAEAGKAFTPAAPIAVRELFAGRTQQMLKVLDTIEQPGMHAILFGERGVGKTSLANVLSLMTQEVLAGKVTCASDDTYTTVWRKALGEFVSTVRRPGFGFSDELVAQVDGLASEIGAETDANQLRLLLGGTNAEYFIVFDEFDRLGRDVVKQFTDTIKIFSDSAVPATLLLVAVADTIDRLVNDHASISRALVQVPMPRMQSPELLEIVKTGAKKLRMLFEPEAANQIVQLSQGLPHYTHLVARNAVRSAARRRSVTVQLEDVGSALLTAVEDAQQSTKQLYHKAIYSSQKAALFRQVLMACALATKDPLSCFQAADVVSPLCEITGRRYEIPAFAHHLSKFCDKERGPVLARSGESRRFQYRFKDPLLEPFVVMQGLASGQITRATLAKMSSQRSS